jgi:hypothetical protein
MAPAVPLVIVRLYLLALFVPVRVTDAPVSWTNIFPLLPAFSERVPALVISGEPDAPMPPLPDVAASVPAVIAVLDLTLAPEADAVKVTVPLPALTPARATLPFGTLAINEPLTMLPPRTDTEPDVCTLAAVTLTLPADVSTGFEASIRLFTCTPSPISVTLPLLPLLLTELLMPFIVIVPLA